MVKNVFPWAILDLYQGKLKGENTSCCICCVKYHYKKLQSQPQEIVETDVSLFVFCGRVNQLIKILGLKKKKSYNID